MIAAAKPMSRVNGWWLALPLLVVGTAVSGCTVDFTGPGSDCGDGVIHDSETCDDANTASGDGCSASCQVEDGWTCVGELSVCETTCGDDVARGTEACDGSDLRSLTCDQLGLGDGDLACGSACSFDTTGCDLQAVCGNGAVESSEECDGDDLAGETCEGLGLAAGTLLCTVGCEYDVDDCSGAATCGNAIIEYPEVCDDTSLGGQVCTDHGFYDGSVVCEIDCAGFDTSGCFGSCGDDLVNGPEECDGANLGGDTCGTIGCLSGQLACNGDCTINPAGCYANHDEDGDSVDDNCDNCPTHFNPGQQDIDGDEVGAACEEPGNETLLSQIEVFESLMTVGSWTVHAGSWTSGVDEVSGSRTNAAANYLHATSLLNVDYSVEATFHMEQPSPSGTSWTAVVFAWAEVGGNVYAYECAYERRDHILSIYQASGGLWNALSWSNISTTVQDSQWHRLRVYREGDSVRCTYTDETGASDQSQIFGADVWSDMSGTSGLRVYNETTTFTSFVIYE
jgi:cysteine-rich repeat protein